jgi:23S rRNA (pseudouridine1915-N3)-methyltransferase
MNITIITVGKLKEKYLKDAIAEYSNQLSKGCRLEIVEVEDEKTPDNASEKEEIQIKAKEGEVILKNIKDNMFVIALAIQGKMLSSEELARQIKDLGIKGDSNLAFVIGGSLGLSDEVLNRANYKLSFSKMTFPHQLMRVILLEQVYRGFRINSGEPYHK